MHECRLLSHFESHRCGKPANKYAEIRVPQPHEKVKRSESRLINKFPMRSSGSLAFRLDFGEKNPMIY